MLQLSHSQSAQLFWVNLLKRAFAKRTTSESPAERTHLGTLPFFLSALQKLALFVFLPNRTSSCRCDCLTAHASLKRTFLSFWSARPERAALRLRSAYHLSARLLLRSAQLPAAVRTVSCRTSSVCGAPAPAVRTVCGATVTAVRPPCGAHCLRCAPSAVRTVCGAPCLRCALSAVRPSCGAHCLRSV